VPTVLAFLTAAAVAFAPANHSAPQQRVVQNQANARIQVSKSLQSELLRQINVVRAQHGLRAFRRSSRLGAAANQHSVSMAQKGYFSHSSADGGAFWRRIATFYGYHGYRQWSVGENLLWSSPSVSTAGALQMWMTSPEHRANLLDRNWREIGLSAVHAESAPGVYHGDAVTIVTADFGVRY
jgi:uncharacterized protein YkwD